MSRFSSKVASFFVVSVVAVVSATGSAALADAQSDLAKSIHWKTGTAPLDQSHGKFTVPPHARLATGSDAQKIDEAINGTDSSDEEAVLFTRGRTLYLSYTDSGFVSADDWKDVDASKMLSSMKDSTNTENAERAKRGVAQFYVDGWVQQPTFDAQRKSVRWIVSLHSAHGRFVNAVALQLGRHGYERFTLVTDGTNPAADRVALANYVQDYRFDPGFRFSDYVTGDKVAGFGVAALVGTAAGVTLAKTGALAAILLLLKKFFVIIIAAGAALYGRFKKSFGSRTKFGPPQHPPVPPAA
jgi:uncharacterized membrane-anchored protein